MADEVSAGGVIIHNGQCLVLKHARGEWIMPKGHLEAGETAEEAAVREVREETNLHARIVAKIGETAYSFRRKDGHGTVSKRVHWFLMTLTEPDQEAQPFIGEGILVTQWLSPDEALARLTFPGDQRILREALAMWRSVAS